MKAAIWKYPLTSPCTQHEVEMPAGATLLSVQMQGGDVTLWAMVDPLKRQERRIFVIVGTGWGFDPNGLQFLGTVQAGQFVWHVFERVLPFGGV